MKRRAVALGISLLLLGLVPSLASASTFTVDQKNLTLDHVMPLGAYIDAQTFKAGLYGPMDSVELFLAPTANTSVYVTLQGTTGSPAVPDGTILASKTLGLTSTGGSGEWVRFSFSTSAIVIPGHVYAIGFTPSDHAYAYGSKADDYANGRALTFYAGSWVSPSALPPTSRSLIADWSFATNVGLAAATPTPTHAPTHTPTHRPTTRPTPTHASTATATPVASATPTPTTTATASSTADVAGATGGAGGATQNPGSGSGSGSGSGGSTMPLLPILIVVIVGLLLLGGLAFLLMRRRRNQPTA
jgi:LPXTG-motif cell wall-anchored protein